MGAYQVDVHLNVSIWRVRIQMLQHRFILRSVRVAERLALPTSDHGVAVSNPAGGLFFPNLNGASLHTPFHRLEMTEILLKGRKTLTHPSFNTDSMHTVGNCSMCEHSLYSNVRYMCHLMTKPTLWHVRPEKTDQPGHPPSLIRVFAVRMKKAWIFSYPLSAQRRLWSDWADAQADLRLRWAHSHFVGFVMRRLIVVPVKHCINK